MTSEEIIKQIPKSEIILSETSGENIEVLFAGDFYPGYRTEELCARQDYQTLFNDILPVLKDKDLSVVNLESPITKGGGGIPKIGPNLRAHPDCIKAVKYGGFDIAALANNHIFDYGSAGLRDTIEACRSAGIKTVGAGLTQSEKTDPLYVNVRSVRAAFVNITENEFSTRADEGAGANGLNPVLNYYQIAKARQNADVVFVVVHGGNELYPLPSPRVVNLYRYFADVGATAVIGHHPHCAGGFEVWNGVPIFYSLGNFVFDVPEKMDASWYTGYAVKLSVNIKQAVKIKLLPYVQFRDSAGINLLKDASKDEFLRLIARYSGIIQNGKELKSSWMEFCKSRRTDYLSRLFRLNRFKTRLYRRGIGSGAIISEEDMMRVLNLIRCEAHRDVILELLNRSINDEEHDESRNSR